ncbi:MAG: T9SS type A sorting domain-containing protein [Chitinophagales bacterium]
MKKFYLSTVIILCFSVSLFATVHIINVEDDIFSPDNLTVMVGDTVRWTWDVSAGFHTTTSTDIPAGAAEWDELIDIEHKNYDYIVTVPGVYDYICIFHEAVGMIASFTATGSTEISNTVSDFNFYLNNTFSGTLHISFEMQFNDNVEISLLNIYGSDVIALKSEKLNEGFYNFSFPMGDLATGMYLLLFNTSDASIVRKLVVQ